jgi:hypothetical protein
MDMRHKFTKCSISKCSMNDSEADLEPFTSARILSYGSTPNDPVHSLP